jgi:uncharacterized protein (DUF1810 family)
MEYYNLNRFIEAQESDYKIALREIKNGRKQSHWMWYIFPQLKGLGKSHNSDFYGINDISEAKAYLANPLLEERVIKIAGTLLDLKSNDALDIMGTPDHYKLKSSMTLFSSVPNSNHIFTQVLGKFFQGKMSRRTLELLNKNNKIDK